jgi:glucokinase
MKENGPEVNMLLAGDIGGTKTLLGLYDPNGRAAPRPRRIVVREFSTLDYNGLSAIIADFALNEPVKSASIEKACFGVAGPVIGNSAELTNVPWRVEAEHVGKTFGISRSALLNDLQAMAYGVPVLQESELHRLQEGEALPGGHMAVIAAGTGLGEAFLHNVDGRFVPAPSEGGHADFAARTEREITLLRDLIQRFGRADVERVVSGHGLVNIYRITHSQGRCGAVEDEDDPEAPAAITRAALDRRCSGCIEALGIFAEAYGAEAGNLALRTVSTAGLFVGGGIAPKILPALTDGRFMRAFRAKAPFEGMLAKMPVKIILNAEVGLLGAAVYAASL